METLFSLLIDQNPRKLTREEIARNADGVPIETGSIRAFDRKGIYKMPDAEYDPYAPPFQLPVPGVSGVWQRPTSADDKRRAIARISGPFVNRYMNTTTV